MSRTITFAKAGGPEVLDYVEDEIRNPAANEVRIKVKAIGLNRAESMWRLDDYIEPITKFPAALGYPAVHYIPRADVDMSALTRSQTATYCPYKGDASYFSIPAGGDRSTDAIWSYEAPFEAVTGIKDFLAFYPDRVDAIDGIQG